jgi:hypothetical protein
MVDKTYGDGSEEEKYNPMIYTGDDEEDEGFSDDPDKDCRDE